MLVIGHRGCRGILPENTLDGFIEAMRLGVDAIELDIIVSGDNEIVVSHEAFMSRTICLHPNGSEIGLEEDQKINLYQMSYEEVKAFDCGLKKHPKFLNQIKLPAYKPLLVEAIIACEAYSKQKQISPIRYIIEIKSKPEWYDVFYPNPKEYVALLLKELASFQLGDRLILKSFDVAILKEIKRQAPEMIISLLINRQESIEDKLMLIDFKPEILGPYYELLDNDIVKKYQNEGFEIYSWTINEPSDMARIKDFGVEGIITDYPDRLLQMLSLQKMSFSEEI